MKIGAMNHPKKDLLQEIGRIGRAKFDFVDLTLEPPAAATWQLDVEAVRRELERWNLNVLVHTAYYIPLATPFAGLRKAGLEEFLRAAAVAGELGASVLTVHFTQPPPFFEEADVIAWCVEVLEPLCEQAAQSDVRIVLENSPKGGPRQVEIFEQLFERLPALGLQLDSGHAHVESSTDRWAEYLDRLGHRLVHVHLSDNDGTSDQHLPLGAVPAGGIDWPEHVRLLKQAGYNRTITLEVFSPRLRYLLSSRDYLLKLWREVEPFSKPET